MARVLIFSFDMGDGTYTNVYTSDTDPTYIINSRPFFYDAGQPPYPTYAPFDQVGNSRCNGTTETRYVFKSELPYASYQQIINSPTCGYIPPVCDLTFSSLAHTDETNTSANDGTVNIFYISSHLPIHYYLIGSGYDNLTGYFTNVPPGTYQILTQDAIGCQDRINVTVNAFNSSLTREKYRLGFKTLKNIEEYQLSFLYQKAQFDPLLYPKYLTGTDIPVKYKKTNSNEDKTEAFIPSSLEINVLVNNIFSVSEFSNAQERDWKIELYKKTKSPISPVSFTGTLTEATVPNFIDGGLQLKINGAIKYTINSSGTQTALLPVGGSYSIEAFTQIAPTGPNPKIRLTIQRGTKVIFDKQIIAVVGASILKTGTVQNANYTITVTTVSTVTPVTTIDLSDNNNPFFILEWQGWLLPDELQDFYTDPNYAISMIATDGILSLKGSTFGDQSLFYKDIKGIKHLTQLYGLKKWGYLVKICLDQLGYDIGLTTILSSLCYQNYKGGTAWLNYATWSDQFYDVNNIPKDTYSALEILLKGMGLQLFQHKGSFILWNINDLYYINSQNVLPYVFLTDFTTISQGILPSNQLMGHNQINVPINPMQKLNYDKAFNRVEGDIKFDLLSLLYPNPSFELNSIEGQLPFDFIQTAGMNAYTHYLPQDPLNPNIGAYAGDWVLRTEGYTSLVRTQQANIPYVQGGTIMFSIDGYKWAHTTNDFIIDQPNKKLNVSFVWRPQYYSPDSNVTTRISIFYTDNISGKTWIYSNGQKAGYNNTGWFLPDKFYGFLPVNLNLISDYIAWNNFSLTTDIFPESGIGHVAVGIGTPLDRDITRDHLETRIIDIDAFVVTLSDAQDQYNFQTGEKHTITNITNFAKSEKKTVDLSLFTYPNNKRVSGNISYGDNYLTSKITNEWYFALSVEQIPDRLPANIIRRFAKNYQRPMYKYEGEFSSDIASFYSIWTLAGYEKRVFICFTLEIDLRNSKGNIVLIEIDDTQMQSTYQYLPIYEKSARNNLS